MLRALALAAAAPLAVAPLQDPGDDALRAAWARLGPGEQLEVVEWFRHEAARLEGFGPQLRALALERLELDPGLVPEGEPPPFFDPAEHAPQQVIPRQRLDPESPTVRRAVERLGEPRRELRSAWTYDWGARELRRVADDRDPELVFHNALLGALPETDLAEALVLRALDRGEAQEVLAAFGHAYTDRSGGVYPLTLYDAWSSGAEMEMPDVDTLGLYHVLAGDWKKFRAPVTRQEALYRDLGERLLPAQRYRQLREALARLYLRPRPVVPRGYEDSVDRLHALWEEHSSEVDALAKDLPDPKGWERYLDRWAATCRKQPSKLAGGQARRLALERDGAAVRHTLVRVMRDAGALGP